MCLYMLSLRDNNMGLGEGRKVLEENKSTRKSGSAPASEIPATDAISEKSSQISNGNINLCHYFQTCGS